MGADGRYDLAMLGTGLPSARWPNGVSCSASPVMARYANPRTGVAYLNSVNDRACMALARKHDRRIERPRKSGFPLGQNTNGRACFTESTGKIVQNWVWV